MNRIIGVFETLFLYICSYIVPKDPTLILFGSMKTKYIGGNPKIYYLYLKNTYPDRYNLLFCDPNNTNTNKKISTYGKGFKKYWLLLRAKYLIIDACSFDLWIHGVLYGNFNLIQMWHWEPIKKIGFLSDLYISRRNPLVLFFEKLEYKTYKYILSNPETKDIIAWTFRNNNILNIGVPRNDVLLDKTIQNLNKNTFLEEELQQYATSYTSIYLLAPTFRETDTSRYFSPWECKKLNEILVSKNILLIIKTHPNETRDYLWSEEYSHLKNVTKTLNFDSTDFLPFIDGIITDYSSIYIDFLLTEKPILWYQKDLNDYIHKERGLLYSPKKVVISETTAYNFDEFITILDSLTQKTSSERYKKSYKKLKEKFYGTTIWKTSSCEQLTHILFPNQEVWKK